MGPSGINVDFTKKNGPDRWPDVFPPGFSGTIQYCLGLAFNIGVGPSVSRRAVSWFASNQARA